MLKSHQRKRLIFAQAILMFCLTLGAGASWAAPKKLALLVGIGAYPQLTRLEGPPNDVAAMQKVLTEQWGYASGDVRTLVDQAATRSSILRELNALVQRSQPGDEVLLYLSGHGTSPLQAGVTAVPDGSGAFYAYDASPRGDNLIVGRTDIRPMLERLDQGGRKVWFVADTCFSGNLTRRAMAVLAPRLVPLVDDRAGVALLQAARERLNAQSGATQPWPYRNVVFLSASAAGEVANDITTAGLSVLPTVDGKPHAAMTDALLRVLKGELAADANADGAISLEELHESVLRFMATRPYGQYPQRLPSMREDANGIGQQPLLRGPAVRAPSARDGASANVNVHMTPAAAQVWPAAAETLRRLPSLAIKANLGADTPYVLDVSRDRTSVQLMTSDGSTMMSAPLGRLSVIEGALHQLAWLARIDALAQAGRRGVLDVEISPAETGVSRYIGDRIDLLVRPDRDGYIMLVNVNGEGEVSVLHPLTPQDVSFASGARVTRLLGFVVDLPEGSDVQLWFAFDKRPANLDALAGLQRAPPGDARLIHLEKVIGDAKGAFTFAKTEFRTYAARPSRQ